MLLLNITITTIICFLIPPNLSLQICVRPNTFLNYVGQLMCKDNNEGTPYFFNKESPERTNNDLYPCISLSVNFAKCDQNDPNATIVISGANTNEWVGGCFWCNKWVIYLQYYNQTIKRKFVFTKWQLSGRKTLVLGIGIEPLAYKTFKLLNVNEGRVQNGGAINYELELKCNILPYPQNKSYVIGSEFYQHSIGDEANFMITVKLYDIEMAHSCHRARGIENSISIEISKNTKHLRTFIVEKSTFIGTHEFELDMQGDIKVVNLLPHSKVNVEAGTGSNSSRGQALSPKIKKKKKAFQKLPKKQ